MNRYRLRAIIAVLAFLLAFMQVPTGRGESGTERLCCGMMRDCEQPDIFSVLGVADDLWEAGELGEIPQKNTVLSVSCEFEGFSLRRLIRIMEALSESRWFLTENMAVKGSRTLRFSYDFQTEYLKLDFTEEPGKPVWPDVLTPALSYRIPAFPFGTYVSGEPITLEDRVDTMKLRYKDVSSSNILSYGGILTEAGWLSETMSDGTVFFQKGTLFVTVLHFPKDRQAEITVGSFRIYLVPLPPWPDTLPEPIRRILPPVAAARKAEALNGGYLCTAEGLTLSELYSFVQSSVGYENWLMLSDDGVMTHAETSLRLEIRSYSTQTNILIFFLSPINKNP